MSNAKTPKSGKISQSTREKYICRALPHTFWIRFWRWIPCLLVYFCLFIFKTSQGDSDAQPVPITNLSDCCALFYLLLDSGTWGKVVRRALIKWRDPVFLCLGEPLHIPKLTCEWQKTFTLLPVALERGISSLWWFLQEGVQGVCVKASAIRNSHDAQTRP